MKKKFTTTLTNAVEPPAPTSVWDYKGCVGKGGKPLNAKIVEQESIKEKETENHD